MADPYKTNCTTDWRMAGYKINNTLAPYSLAVSKKLYCFYLLSKINCETFLQTCQRYCLQKDITRECQCFHPNLVVAMVNSTFDKRPCLITPDNNSKILYINTTKKLFTMMFFRYWLCLYSKCSKVAWKSNYPMPLSRVLQVSF